MAKMGRIRKEGSTHKKNVAKAGRPQGKQGKQASPFKKKCRAASAGASVQSLKSKVQKLLVALAAETGKGTPYDEGQSTTAQRVTMHCIDDADLSWDDKKGDVRGLDAAYREASRLTDVSMSTLREKFLSFLDSEGAT